MGIFKKADSKFWWIFLESTKKKIKTDYPIGTTRGEQAKSQALAKAEYHKLILKPAQDPDAKPDISFEEWATVYDTDTIAHHQGAERERAALQRLRDGFSYKDDGTLRLLREFDKDLVKKWRTDRMKRGLVTEHFGGPKGPRKVFAPPGARTVNREVDVLQQIIAAAVPKYLAVDPLVGLEDIDHKNPKRRTMSIEEEEKILPFLAVDDRAIVLMGLETLARMKNILDLKREDDHGTYVELIDTKNGASYQPPVSKRLRAALDAVPADPRSEYYFPRRRVAKTERDRRNVIAGMLRRACKKAHVPYGRGKGITFHWATRRTGTTRLLRAGGEGSIAAVQQIGGWKSAEVPLTIYREVSTPEMKALVELVGKGVKTPKPGAPATKVKRKKRTS